jgi:RND family efflux transporter MFP subunit
MRLDIKREVVLLVALFTTMYLSLGGCGADKKNPREKVTATEADTIPIRVAIAEKKDLVVSKTYSGTLEGVEQANIVAKISERVVGITKHVGDAVRAGETIVALDKSGPSSQYYQAEANFHNAEKNLERMKSLYQEGAVSLQTLDATQTAYDVAKANFEAARSSVELTSPISGVVTAMNVSVGDLAMPGAVLATVANISQMKVIFSVGEVDISHFSLGQRVKVYSELQRELVVEGRVTQLSKSADVRSRSFEVKALFANTRDRWFKPGMFCKAEVRFVTRQGAIAIPRVAIVSSSGVTNVYVISSGRAFLRNVQTGESDGEMTEIVRGLRVGDTVATVGVANLKDSCLVVLAR